MREANPSMPSNPRFHILPWSMVPNLDSYILALVVPASAADIRLRCSDAGNST